MTLTPKQIAQTYVLDDIIIHELILSAINEVESYAIANRLIMTVYDITHRTMLTVCSDALFNFFKLDSHMILRTLHNEYQQELSTLSQDLERRFNTPTPP